MLLTSSHPFSDPHFTPCTKNASKNIQGVFLSCSSLPFPSRWIDPAREVEAIALHKKHLYGDLSGLHRLRIVVRQSAPGRSHLLPAPEPEPLPSPVPDPAPLAPFADPSLPTTVLLSGPALSTAALDLGDIFVALLDAGHAVTGLCALQVRSRT